MNCKTVETSSYPSWIIILDDINREDIKQNRGTVLPLTDELGFDLNTWEESDKRESTEHKSNKRPWQQAMFTLIRRDGLEVRPVICSESWQIVDGKKRLMIMRSIRVTGESAAFIGFEFIKTQNREERREYRDRRQCLTQPFTKNEKTERASDMLRNHPDYSDRFVGILTGLSADKVADISFELEQKGEIRRPENRLGLDGKCYPAKPNVARRKKEQRKQITFEDTKQNKDVICHKLCLPLPDLSNDEFQMLAVAWLEEFGLVSVSASHITHMMIRRSLSRATLKGSYPVDNKNDSRRVGIWLSQVAKQKRIVGDYILVPTVTASNKITYQLLPVLWISPSLLQHRLEEAAGVISESSLTNNH